MKIVVRKLDKRIVFFTDKKISCIPHAVILAGGSSDDYEELEVDHAGYAQAKACDPVEIKARAFLDILPSWAQVETAVDSISSLAEAKAFLKKLSRVVYWLARDQEK